VERVADPRLRVVLYHIPQFSAVPITFPVIERLRARYPGVFTGIKDSAGDLAHMQALVERFPGLAVLAGADPLMLPLLKKGGAGCITATSNLVAAALAFFFRHCDDPARAAEVEAAQARVVAGRNRASRFAQMASLKVLVAARTGEEGWRRMRPPLLPLSAEEEAALLEV
jgi:4-hydroxy-tetrahydrodipicolinate synthase